MSWFEKLNLNIDFHPSLFQYYCAVLKSLPHATILIVLDNHPHIFWPLTDPYTISWRYYINKSEMSSY